MNRILKLPLVLVLSAAMLLTGRAYAADFKDAQVFHIDYPGWFHSDPFFDLAEATAKAKASGKDGLMILFTTQGCSYCAIFIDKSLGNPDVAKRVQKHFVSVGMEIFDDTEMTAPGGEHMPVKVFAKKEGAGFSPTLVFFDTDGKRTLGVVGYQSTERFNKILDYITAGTYKTETLASYFAGQKKNTPARSASAKLKDDPLFIQPPYALDRSRFPASLPMMVLFEEPGCSECDDFHNNVLALDEVRNTLKGFEVVRLDSQDKKTPVITPGGKRVTPAKWYMQSGFARVPALMFFDLKGNQVLETDALVKRNRMMNSLNYMLERAYEKDWTYQRFARSKAIERNRKKQDAQK
jgi:thioredoxin-related protein